MLVLFIATPPCWARVRRWAWSMVGSANCRCPGVFALHTSVYVIARLVAIKSPHYDFADRPSCLFRADRVPAARQDRPAKDVAFDKNRPAVGGVRAAYVVCTYIVPMTDGLDELGTGELSKQEISYDDAVSRKLSGTEGDGAGMQAPLLLSTTRICRCWHVVVFAL